MTSSNQSGPVSTVAGITPVSVNPADPALETAERCLESQLLLARARVKLLGLTQDKRVSIGRYRVLERIGSGGMGIVYEAHDDELDRRVALKLLSSELGDTVEGRQRLIREAQAMAKLSHPNVVHVYEIGHSEEQIFIAMELVRGMTLRRWARRRVRPWRETLAMFVAAARGLEAAHAVGLVHRDFKPDNVIVDEDDVPHVLDFGLARPQSEVTIEEPAAISGDSISSGADLTLTGTVVGTPAYMPPEQLMGRRSDHRADQFAFCVALYEALVGRRPFSGRSVTELAASVCKRRGPAPSIRRGVVPSSVRAAIKQGLSLDPEDRFPSMTELIERLEPHVKSRPRSSRTVGFFGAAAMALSLATGSAWLATDRQDVAPLRQDALAEIIAESDLPPTIAEPLAEDPANVTVHRLRNGLTVYVASRSGEPSVVANVVVRADQPDEREGEEGLAQLLPWVLGDTATFGSMDPEAEAPHLERYYSALEEREAEPDLERRWQLAQDALDALRTAAPLVVPAEVSSLGSELGFGTLFLDRKHGTTILQEVPRNRLDTWATLMAEGLLRPAFRGFFGGIRVRLDSLRSESQDAAVVELQRRLGTATSLPLEIDAEAANLADLPFSRMRGFWETYYRPNNTAIVLVGDVTAVEVLPVIEASFGEWEAAQVPEPRPPKPLPTGGRLVSRVVDAGPTQVLVAWPRVAALSSPEIEAAIEEVILNVPLAQAWFAEDGRARFSRSDRAPMYLQLRVEPAGEHTLHDAEAAAFDYLHAVATGDIPDGIWRAARGQAQLNAFAWSESPYALATTIGDSFARRVPWEQYVPRISGAPLSRDTVLAAAHELERTGAVVVHRQNGADAPIRVSEASVPKADREFKYADFPSPFAKRILEQPLTPLEPQFLVAGGDYRVSRLGEGQLITVDDDSPVFHLAWILGAGVQDSALACDAWRAVLASRSGETEALGVSVRVICGVHETVIGVRGIASRLEEAWPTLRSLLRSPGLDERAIRRHIARTLDFRAFARSDELKRNMGTHMIAVMGEQGVDHWMPTDRELAASGRGAFLRALETTLRRAPDVLYAGPQAASFGERLAPLQGERQAAQLLRPRVLERSAVFVMHAKGRSRAEIQRTVGVDTAGPRDILFGDLMRSRSFPDESFENVEPVAFFAMPIAPTLNANGVVANIAVECGHVDVPSAIGALQQSQQAPPPPEQWERARAMLEAGYRSARRSGMQRAEAVRQWAALGRRIDPAVKTWLELRSVTQEDLTAFHESTVAAPAVVSLVADLDRLDLDELKEFGRVVRLRPEMIRDYELTDLRIWGLGSEPW